MKQEHRLAVIVVGSQLVMIALVGAVLVSPWYSQFFYQMLKEQALENYREFDSTTKGRVPPELVRLCVKPGVESSAIQLHVDEEIALKELTQRPGSYNVVLGKFRRELNKYRKQKGTTSDIAEIALQKLIRLELRAAELLLAEGSEVRAQTLVNSALDDLKSQRGQYDLFPQKLHVQKILELTYKINETQEDRDGMQKAKVTLIGLADPASAKDYFQSHGLNGYAGSYPSEYLVKYYLMGSSLTRHDALVQATEICKRKDVRPSTRTLVLQSAINEALQKGDSDFANTVLEVWMMYYAGKPVRLEPDAFLAMSLKEPMIGTQNMKIRDAVTAAIRQGIDKDLLPNQSLQNYFDVYERDLAVYKLWPPSSGKVGSEREKEIDCFIEVCKKRKLDDFYLRIAKNYALMAQGKLDEAEKLIYEMLANAHSVDGAKFEEKQERLCEAAIAVASTIGGGHNEAAYERANKIEQKAWTSCNWLEQPRLSLMQSLYNYVQDPAARRKCLDEIMRSGNRMALSDPKKGAMDFFVLNNIMIGDSRPDDGEKLMNQIHDRCGDSPAYVDLCKQLLGFRRAYPSYSPESLKICREKAFPNDVFQSTPDLIAEVRGKTPDYYMCLSWLAQYEACRQNNKRAIEICKQILSNPHVGKMACYITTKDFLGELTGEIPKYPDGTIFAGRGSIIELNCLTTLYLQLHRPKASERIRTLKARVQERD